MLKNPGRLLDTLQDYSGNIPELMYSLTEFFIKKHVDSCFVCDYIPKNKLFHLKKISVEDFWELKYFFLNFNSRKFSTDNT